MVYNINEFNPTRLIEELPIQKRKRGNQGTRQNRYSYKDVICAFDIETTLEKIGEHNGGTKVKPRIIEDFVAIMYIWQFQIGKDITIIGRTWEEFNHLMSMLDEVLKNEDRLCVFVHNLSYEFQFLRDDYILGKHINEESVFCVKSRTPIKFLCFNDKIEFRCSYIHSNMSLDEFTDKMQVEHRKLSGIEFDYTKKRYPWTVLTEKELEYCYNDVIGLVECLYKECEIDGDNLYTLPLTSTGYVRRDIKRAIQKLPHNYIEKQLPDYHIYTLLRESFRGGNTHASRFYSNKRIDGDIYCNDIASSYPNIMINCKFPVTPFREIEEESRNINHILSLIKKGRAVIMQIAIFNVKLRDEFWAVPYLSRDKCRNIVNAEYDNGRIIKADYIEITVTDIDFQIICNELDDECIIEVIDAYFASYGYLPDEIRNVIRYYFMQKTALKGVEDQIIFYNKMKALLNAIYGMTAQNPVKLDECYFNGEYLTGLRVKDEDGDEYILTEEEAERLGENIYKMAHTKNIDKSTMPYQWGVWVTAWARLRLEEAIKLCGNDFLYCDTDSVYYIGVKDFSAYNDERIKDSTKNKAFAQDKNGVTHYMGVLELDKHVTSFKTMGAKKYAYIKEGKLYITIAGVSKKRGSDELTAWAKSHGMKDGLDAMREDFVFNDAGGTESVYNDTAYGIMEIDGHELYVPSNVAIKPSTYKVGLSEDYGELLSFLFENDLFGLYRMNYNGAQLPSIEM